MEKVERPIILVTNDDGIFAPGITFLAKVASKFGRIVVVAPDKPQSGMGHAITINSTLRIQKTNHHNAEIEYACSGTPVDCVKMAVNHILKKRPDIVLSGINHGSNSSINVIYSGTMSAAIEGALEGTPSIGFSLCDYAMEADFSQAEKFVSKIIEESLKNKMPKGVCLNVNIPKLKEADFKGIKVVRQARANWVERFEERKDPYGREYYWLTGEFVNFEPESLDTDEWALKNGYISVVPTQADLTAHKYLTDLKHFEKI
ncbi:5'/3'-nucleotidase SurE [Aurantibacillus circumpalustris]|uniref:5'/3'-nucleotidase SurE n=1 Tax=Aurantibacillus circumpalustris TaxID=3036359 RepID=UPI00295C3798|nr:5'/3'-nucleotidase SurE [Aurantibacillus circumpalustris]